MNNPALLRKLAVPSGALLVLSALAACTDSGEQRLDAARRALASQPDVEIVNSDAGTGLITIRSRASGAVSVVDLNARPSSTSSPTAAPAATPAAAPAWEVAPSTATATAIVVPAAEVAEPAAVTPAAPPDNNSAARVPAAAAVITRDSSGRVARLEGPGFSVQRVPNTRAAQPQRGPDTYGSSGGRTTDLAAGPRRRLTAPVVCGAGAQVVENVDIDVPGAGIVAERGCKLRVTNVRLRAGGWGLVVNPGASVSVDSSLIEGKSGALDLYPGAVLSAWGSTFRGTLGRPMTAAEYVDRGGNFWD